MQLGQTPKAVESAVWLVRFDDDLQPWWGKTDAEFAAALDAPLQRLITQAEGFGLTSPEIQLDFDVPVSKLQRWAAILAILQQSSLSGHSLWITSLPSHLRESTYGDLFRGVVAGHMIQVFDTGQTPEAVATVLADVEAAHMPFRLGLGAFERAHDGAPVTDHRAWFKLAPQFVRSKDYRGTWVFPAGRPWTQLQETP